MERETLFSAARGFSNGAQLLNLVVAQPGSGNYNRLLTSIGARIARDVDQEFALLRAAAASRLVIVLLVLLRRRRQWRPRLLVLVLQLRRSRCRAWCCS